MLFVTNLLFSQYQLKNIYNSDNNENKNKNNDK